MSGVRYWPLAVAIAVSLVMLFSPGSAVPSSPENTDKITHILMFAVLAITSVHARIPRWITALWLAGYALVSEVLQAALPISRSGDLADAAADIVGVGIGISITVLVSRRRSSSPRSTD
ncbi:VanZ family protein [Rhodococcus sp. 27YEA15]|uniref:VanZ family protein n=1 Tax=Rhodococcus sp. 27YEA15 TaxID=3156259 RepID=UPI003C7A58E5